VSAEGLKARKRITQSKLAPINDDFGDNPRNFPVAFAPCRRKKSVVAVRGFFSLFQTCDLLLPRLPLEQMELSAELRGN
jgi:hypothetical protein